MTFSKFLACCRETWWHAWCWKWSLPNAKSSLFDPITTFVFNEVQSTVFANITSPQKVQHSLGQRVNGDLVEIWDSSGPSLVALIYGKARYFLNNEVFAAWSGIWGESGQWLSLKFPRVWMSLDIMAFGSWKVPYVKLVLFHTWRPNREETGRGLTDDQTQASSSWTPFPSEGHTSLGCVSKPNRCYHPTLVLLRL